jgi:hypothetical protein
MSMDGSSLDRSRPWFARMYERVTPGMEAKGMAELRRELLAGLSGCVLEVGAGNGMNFAHYPAAVIALTAVEPEPHLRELYRVIRPGGQLRFLEHVAADGRALRLLQRVADASVWPMLTGGCRTARDPLHAIVQPGFDVRTVRRLRFPVSRLPVPSAPHLLGTAQRP